MNNKLYSNVEVEGFINEVLNKDIWKKKIGGLNVSTQNMDFFKNCLDEDFADIENSYERYNVQSKSRKKAIRNAVFYWLKRVESLSDNIAYKIVNTDDAELVKEVIKLKSVNVPSGQGLSLGVRCIYKGILQDLILNHPDFKFKQLSLENKDRVLVGLYRSQKYVLIKNLLVEDSNLLENLMNGGKKAEKFINYLSYISNSNYEELSTNKKKEFLDLLFLISEKFKFMGRNTMNSEIVAQLAKIEEDLLNEKMNKPNYDNKKKLKF
jgi:hypothetical protein